MTTPTPHTLTLEQTAAVFHVSASTMRTTAFRARLTVAGLREVRVGKRVLVLEKTVKTCLEHLRTDPQWGPGRKAVR